MHPDPVVVVAPVREHGLGLAERGKKPSFEAFVSQPAIEAFGEGVLLRLAGCRCLAHVGREGGTCQRH